MSNSIVTMFGSRVTVGKARAYSKGDPDRVEVRHQYMGGYYLSKANVRKMIEKLQKQYGRMK